ncbi:MAG: hypothetical protein WC870_01460 [Candidatus Paceibacterota bacterium]
MTPKIRNIIIFVTIAAVFVLIYIFFIKPSPPEANLVSSPSTTNLPNIDGSSSEKNNPNMNSEVAKDFLALLLSVKNIKLNDAIFSDPAFSSLHDSSITLTPSGTEGRPNPFAQFGSDSAPVSLNTPN